MIVILDGSDEVYYEDGFPEHDVLVYYYESDSYDGSGFAAWKYKDDFYYGSLSH